MGPFVYLRIKLNVMKSFLQILNWLFGKQPKQQGLSPDGKKFIEQIKIYLEDESK